MSDFILLPPEDEPPPSKGLMPHPYSTQIVTSLNECKKLWQKFSPNQTIYDIWEFRLAFYLAYQHQPHFIVLYHHQIPVGLIPLWFDIGKQHYDWFGSYWHEHNNFWVTDPKYLPLLLRSLPIPSVLRAINPSQIQQLNHQLPPSFILEPDEPTFSLKLNQINNHNNYLLTLKKKTRYNLKRDWQKITQLHPTVTYDRFDDILALIALNTQRFLDKGEEPDCLDPRRAQAFKNLLILALESQKYQIRMISIEIEHQLAVVDLIAIYQKTYYSLKGGSDLRKFPGIGNYINLLEIDDACNLGMKKIDFLQSPQGWKNAWFEPQQLWILKKLSRKILL